MVLFAECVQSFISIREDCLLTPGFDSFNGLTLVRIGWYLFLLFRGFTVLLTTFLVLFFDFFLRLNSEHKLLFPEVEESTSDWFPFLLDVPLTIGINAQSFLFHKQQSLSIKMNLFLDIV